MRVVYILSTVHDDRMVDAPASKGAHEKTKLLAVVDYNKYRIGADKLDQLLTYYSFQKKSVKWWKKLFFHLFDRALVNVQILHRMKCKENFRLYRFMEKVAEGLVSNAGIKIKQQSQKSSARILMGRDHFAYRIPAKSSKQAGISQCTCKVCTEKVKHHAGKSTKKFTAVYCPKYGVGLCMGECFDVYHSRVNYWE
jgi:hypothetical protein